ncbi:alanine--tRNA ligase [Parasporobacterium paucivorans]|uniref:Alanine--tRNA ligase n=1 Tax=Parasporobacterium paucivorans DSM 15970 TaxID=1122934 RepID=A0A1M6A150_9FIRM|nr:alanine--tRNA ligase [Parasporobacterium paucivorans]SHI30185.1 alanyl-tRNA synthetase [Parasporobacterium paucivorans DSM 15970]
MTKYGLNELREMFLRFFEGKDHLRLSSFSLVPHNDNSLLLINSGMAPLKPYFTGQEIPPKARITTCQKCIRTGDIENVGKTARHGTFFEMLGNFSFGDYFKKESIRWSWEFLTEVVGLDPARLYPSVYLEDDDAFDIWHLEMGIDKSRIFRFGKEDNFWEHGAGPCGPCSEIYYDRGEKYGCGSENCTVGCDCDRYIEVWNNVFTQFESDGKGNYTDLAKKNIDTGMGLERLAVVVQDVESIFDVDTIQAIRNRVCEFSGAAYLTDPSKDISIRLITDHIRSATFMISDGIMPSNEGRGYVLRRLIRRAARHGKLLNIEGKFLAKLCDTVIAESKGAYPELEEKKSMVFAVLTEEENKFYQTIDGGLKILTGLKDDMTKSGSRILSGEEAFKLYDTYGFPLDLTREILEEQGLGIDEEGFTKAMQEQKQKARAARGVTNYMGADSSVYEKIDPSVTSVFIGYDNEEFDSEITVLTSGDEIVQALSEGDSGSIITKETPFYPEMGGQTGDLGAIRKDDAEFTVSDTIKLPGGKIAHVGKVTRGMLMSSDHVRLFIDTERRNDTRKNHSATHLLHKALKSVLGEHVEQAGSLVSPDRLRFDFTHFSAMSPDEIRQTENIVNFEIGRFLPVVTKEMTLDDAKKSGATALFGEKYSDTVRVVSMGDFSTELCGGTHVDNTGKIMVFKILSEAGVAAGVRRIEAQTGKGVFAYYENLENELFASSRAAKTEPAQLTRRVEDMLSEIKSLHSENEKLKNQIAKSSMGNVNDKVSKIKGVSVIAEKIDDMDMNGLRNLGDQLKDKLKDGVVVLASSQGPDKVNLIVMVTEEAMNRGLHAGNLIKEIAPLVGGGGGGRPNMAQAGGKKPSGIADSLTRALEIIENQIKS